MNKKLRAVTLAVVVIFSSNTLVLAESSSSLQDKIEQNQNDISNLENEKDKVNGEIEDQSSELQGILNQIDEKGKDLESAKAEVDSYQAKIDEVQSEIDRINSEITSAENEISTKEALITEKEEEGRKIKEALDQRVRNYYKMDVTANYIYMILRSESIVSLFNNIQNVFRIMTLDKGLMESAKEIQKQLEDEKVEISKKLEEIEADKNEVIAKQDELKEAQKEFIVKQEFHQSKMDELYGLESQKSGLIASLSDKEKELEEQIGDLVSYNQELQAALDSIFNEINNGSNNGGSNSGGGNSGGDNSGGEDNSGGNIIPGDPSGETFLRPGYGIVTDPYGPRINPVTGEAGFHTGVDLGDPYGAPVAASKSGVVAYSGWISGYGNTIIIDHGSGVQTLYGHNSELLVSVGQTVARGQTIAYVGSTGMSTGPHIHWEIRINGQHIDPSGYL
ncbi:M23 family metallopeptidase [Clostridium sp. 1001275B_160808_H3]|uniref:murein hydrolase activator EnvC family protein n=1 Tax=Clostridium sp. 1001275B_160808_H3 TaxID=2787110 RepID=UPI00189717C2|nr:M23 family metallopeptidase [Clostridium sp. 1001275B_160808_H3]